MRRVRFPVAYIACLGMSSCVAAESDDMVSHVIGEYDVNVVATLRCTDDCPDQIPFEARFVDQYEDQRLWLEDHERQLSPGKVVRFDVGIPTEWEQPGPEAPPPVGEIYLNVLPPCTGGSSKLRLLPRHVKNGVFEVRIEANASCSRQSSH